MNKTLPALSLGVFLLCTASPNLVLSAAKSLLKQDTTASSQNVTYKLIPVLQKTWGYDIYIENKLIIHQPSRPALPGNNGFKNKKQAAAAARLVVSKVKRGQMPPAVTVDELQKAGAL